MLGLATRRFPALFPEFIVAYAGDALWAATAFWLLAMVFPAAPPWRLAAGAAGVAMTVEVSQLYHAPWIDEARATWFGALLLGRGFLWSDFLCYAVGIVTAAAFDLGVQWRRPKFTGARDCSLRSGDT
jgi:hypothetical protein